MKNWALALVLVCTCSAGDEPPVTNSPKLNASIARQHKLQEQLAAKWASREQLSSERQRIALAISCLCTHAGEGASLFDSETGRRLTAEARAYLLARKEQALPQLVTALAARRLRDENGMTFPLDHVTDLLGQIGDRDSLVPLLRQLLEPNLKPGEQVAFWLPRAVAQIGDPDTVAALMKLYPWEENQSDIARVIGMAGGAEVVPALAAWATTNARGRPSRTVLHALASIGDPRAEPILRQLMKSRNAEQYAFVIVRGLAFLGKKDVDVNSLSDKPYVRSQLAELLESAPKPLRFPLRHKGHNAELRRYVDARLAELRRRREQPISEGGLKLSLQASATRIMVGQKVTFDATITNTGSKPVKVMRSRDGSDVEWVMPKIKASIWGPDHLPVQYGAARCGNVSPLAADDVRELKPGEVFDLFGPGSFGHYMLEHFSTAVPGTYQVKIAYETSGRAPRGGLGDDGSLPEGVAAVHLESNLVQIEVLPPEEAGKRRLDERGKTYGQGPQPRPLGRGRKAYRGADEKAKGAKPEVQKGGT